MFAEPVANREFFNPHDVGTPSLSGDGLQFSTRSPFGSFPGASKAATSSNAISEKVGGHFA